MVVGITDALSMPSFQSIVPSSVEPPHLAAGLALNSTQFNWRGSWARRSQV